MADYFLQHQDEFYLEEMETDEFFSDLSKLDPNLNVTSAPEQLDLLPESPAPLSRDFDPDCYIVTDGGADNGLLQFHGDYGIPDLSADLTDLCALPDSGQPALRTVTLVKPKSAMPNTLTMVSGEKDPLQCGDPETVRLLQELYREEPDSCVVSCGLKELGKQPTAVRPDQQSSNPGVNVSCLPQLEPLVFQQNAGLSTEPFDQLSSPSDTVDTGFCCDEPERRSSSTEVTPDRDAELNRKAAYIRDVIVKRGNKPDDMSSKLKVHEVILVILLNSTYGDRSKNLQRILTFCDENGRESSEECKHFKTLDTETMGLLWQKIKGNRKNNYDTFARAMRVRRERSEGFFDYLDAGKGKKKRIYRFGNRSMEEMTRFKKTLRQISKPQTCSF